MPIEQADQSRLGSSQLGSNAVLGRRVWDRQSKFRIRIGPLSASQYADFLPSGSALPKLVDWVRFYTGGELFWDVQLILQGEQVSPMKLGQSGQLGWSGWLGQRQGSRNAENLVLDAERVMAGRKYS
jgi:type VI secretion system protein ImpH